MPQRIAIVDDLGTTKLASDSYDIDNIYLSEEGWVYRHFKSTDGSRYWDEILVAGEVPAGDSPEATNPPKLGTVAAPTYETGDGSKDWEYSEHQTTGTPGVYTTKVVPADGGGGIGVGDGEAPAAGNIGTISGTAPSGVVMPGTAYPYTAAAEGAGTTFTWTTSDGDGVLSATTGASVNITWATPGSKTVTVTAALADADDDGATKTYNENVTAFTIGNVTNSGDASVGTSTDTTVSVTIDGNISDPVYAWTITGGTGNSGDASFGSTSAATTTFQSTSTGTFDLTCTITSAEAGGAGGDGTGTKTSELTVTVA